VQHCTIQINHQPDATIFEFIILTFVYSSTYFRRLPAHHQEFNDGSKQGAVSAAIQLLMMGGKTPEKC
jgi:hypothetical protein